MPAFLGNHTVRWNEVLLNGGKGITGSFGSTGPFPASSMNVTSSLDGNNNNGSFKAQPCRGCEVHRNFGGRIAFNVIAGNNFLGCNAYENGALKVHGFSGTVEGNLLIDNPYSVGMWFDDLWWDLRVTRNVIVVGSTPQTREWLNDERIQMAGIMLEVSTGPALIDNNVIR